MDNGRAQHTAPLQRAFVGASVLIGDSQNSCSYKLRGKKTNDCRSMLRHYKLRHGVGAHRGHGRAVCIRTGQDFGSRRQPGGWA